MKYQFKPGDVLVDINDHEVVRIISITNDEYRIEIIKRSNRIGNSVRSDGDVVSVVGRHMRTFRYHENEVVDKILEKYGFN